MVSLCKSCPLSSKQTILHPDRNPGSIARILFSPIGLANKSCFRFLANISIDCISAFSLASLIVSVEIEGSKCLVNASLHADFRNFTKSFCSVLMILSSIF